MGLDNGIIIKLKENKELPDSIKNARNYYVYNWRDNNEIDIIYWRKWWGVRNAIMWSYPDSPINDGEIDVDEHFCNIAIAALEHFDNEETWNDEGSPIWEYEECEIHEQITDDINTLKELKVFLNSYSEDIEYCRFYDSY